MSHIAENLFVSRPQVRVTFYPQTGVNLGKPISLDLNAEKADDLISVQTTKILGQPCGHFSITMAPKQLVEAGGGDGRWYEQVLRPGDMAVIEMGPDRPQPETLAYAKLMMQQGYSGLEPVMIGSIDQISQSTSFSGANGAPERSITVSGRDFAKYLVDDQIYFDGWAEPQRALTGLSPEIDFWMKSGMDKGGKPATLVLLLLNFIRSNFDVSFHLSDQRDYSFIGHILRYALTLESPSVAAVFKLLTPQGAPWALMERAASSPLYVLTLDTRRHLDVNRILDPTGPNLIDNNNTLFFNNQAGKKVVGHWDSQVSLMLYRNPWMCRAYQGDWTNLPTRVVEDRDLIAMELSRSNDEVSNTWRVWAETQGIFRTQGGGDMADAETLKDRESIRRYGNRPVVMFTDYISGFGNGEQKDIVKRFSRQLKDWNRWNEWYLSGRIQMKGMASVKVGDRLWHWDQLYGDYTDRGGFDGGVDYYVEGVTQEFRAFTGWTTTVQVCRGQNHVVRNQTYDFSDITFDGQNDPQLVDPNSAKRKALKKQAEQIWVWGNSD